MKKAISKILYYITKLTPKFDWIIIQTYPIWEDNGVAVYEYYKNTHKIIWLIPDKLEFIPFQINKNTIFLKRNSIRAIFYYIFSRYVFMTHGLYFRKFPKNQISVNLWHGMPLKRIGVEKGKSQLITNYTLSTSVYFNQILAEAFKISQNSILPIGLPRNVRLFTNREETLEKLKVSSTTKIIFWLPTYRKSVEGDVRIDGIDFGNVFNMPNFDTKQFCILLKELDIICYVKPHPMSVFHDIYDNERLKIINDTWLYKKKLTLYEALSVCDILITDISSVLVDFLLVNKPIIFAFPDKEAYIKSRGLATDSFLKNLPGPFCINQFEITKQLTEICNKQDNYLIQREKLKLIYHENENYLECIDNLNTILSIK